MRLWEYLFLVSGFLVFFNYAGYLIPVYLLGKYKRSGDAPQVAKEEFYPSVSFIVAAYNEEDCIAQKITNSLEQDYPEGKIEFLFITDGSDDGTAGIVGGFSRIRALHQSERKGKSAALNRAVRQARHEILIFSDANTVLNPAAVRNIARHYRDEAVGGVAGEKKVLRAMTGEDETGDGEGLYWKYESFLKKSDSAFYSVVGAAGELFSFRTRLYEALPDSVVLDDFVSSLKVAQKGYRVLYEPEAYATELPSFSLKDEQKRKIRIAAGGFQAMWMLRSLLAFWKYPRLSYLYISHRVLRWAISPLCLLLALVSNGVIFFSQGASLFRVLFVIQLAFYGMAALAFLAPSLKQRSRLVKLCSYFVFMNVSVIQGFFRFLRGRQAAVWEKAKRAQG